MFTLCDMIIIRVVISVNSRMDKYEFVEPELTRRTDKNADLYLNNEIEDYNKIDLNSNISVLKTDSRKIDVDQIREMLDKKYRDNLPKRKSIAIEAVEEEIPTLKADTKEYDINEILAKAKQDVSLDYQKERLKKVRDTNYDILDKLNLEAVDTVPENNEEDAETASGTYAKAKEKELLDLINTVTELEAKNLDQSTTDLLDLKNDDDSAKPTGLENSFYTGELIVQNDDFDDLKDEIKTNSLLIKVLVAIFVIIIVVGLVLFLNSYFDWGLL